MKRIIDYIKNHLNIKVLIVFMGTSATTVFILLAALFYTVYSRASSFATEEQIFTLLKEMSIVTVIIVPMITVVMIAIFLRFLQYIIVKPVNLVKKVTQTISDGDFTIEVRDDIKFDDEIGVMMRSLSSMVKIQRNIVKTMNNYTEGLASSSENMENISSKMVTMSQDQAASMEQASAALEETLTSMELINERSTEQYNKVDKNSERMANMAGEANDSYDEALNVTQLMEQTVVKARNGEDYLNDMVKEMQNIKESTSKIEEIIGIISDISDQVNLLSLNAAIEAARAGDHGKGFAVVADEISKLAEQTADSAKTINDLVSRGNNQVDAGTEIVNRTAGTFHDIIESIENVSQVVTKFSGTLKLLADTASESKEKTGGIKQISRSISDATDEQMSTNKDVSSTIDKVNVDSQVLVEYAGTISTTSDDIRKIALELKDNLKNFKV